MSVKRDDSGRYVAHFRYKDYTGKIKQKRKVGFATKKAALEYERDFLNRFSGNSSITFANLVDYYLDDCKNTLKASTLSTKYKVFHETLIPLFGKYPINEITPLMVRQWQNTLIQKYKPTTQKNTYSQLVAIMHFAEKYFSLVNNPCNKVPTIGSLKSTKMEFLTIEQFKQLIQAMDDNPKVYQFHKASLKYYRLVFIMLFYTGMRTGELMALTMEDYDAENAKISITKTFSREHGQTSPKTATSNRVIDLPSYAKAALDDYIAHLPVRKKKTQLFNMVNRSSLLDVLTRYLEIAGLPRIVLHDFRHSHASLLIHLGVQPLAISKRLGHADIQTTLDKYGHLYPSDNDSIIAQIDKIS